MGGMFDFMENPYMGQYMGQMGLGLLAASQPQPYGVNRYSLIQNSMNQANQNLMQQQMFDMKKEEYEEKKKERNKIKTAQSKLFGGEDPSTGVTWDAGRVGMSPEETMSNVGQVAPGAAIEHMLAEPKEPKIIKGADGFNYYTTGPQKGKRVLPNVERYEKPTEGTYTWGGFLPDGSAKPFPARMGSKGNTEVLTPGGEWKSLAEMGPGALMGKLGVQGTSTEGLTPGARSKEIIDLRDHRINTINLAKAGQRLVKDLGGGNGKNIGFTGAIERYFDTGIRQGQAFASRWNDKGLVDRIAEDIQWSSALAAESAATRSQIASLAYSVALTKNGTRPTDEDVRNAMKILGASGSPQQMAAAVDSYLRESFDSYATRHKEITGSDWDAAAAMKEHGLSVPGEPDPARLEYINQLGLQDLTTELNKPGITKAELDAIEKRMDELGY